MATLSLARPRDRRGFFSNFLADETGFNSSRAPAWLAKYALVLLILNEIRGLFVVAGVVKVWWP